MSVKPRALDLYCKAGGAARGLALAGFEVVGVDVEPQPNYPYEFIQADVLAVDGEGLPVWWSDWDLIWASPPCLANTALRHAPNAKKHEDLIAPTRNLLKASGRPYVIENVVGAESLRVDLMLRGNMFDLGVTANDVRYTLARQRNFEVSFPVPQPTWQLIRGPVIGIYGGHVRCRSAKHGGRGTRDFVGLDKDHLAADALGLPRGSMTMDEYSNAIPPAYACYIATHALAAQRKAA